MMSVDCSDEEEFFDTVDDFEKSGYGPNFHSQSHFVEDLIGQHIPFAVEQHAENESNDVILEGDDDLLVNSRPLFPVVKTDLKKMASRSSEVVSRKMETDKNHEDCAKKRASADSIRLVSQDSLLPISFDERARPISPVGGIEKIAVNVNQERQEPMSPLSPLSPLSEPSADLAHPKVTQAGNEGGFLSRIRKAIIKQAPPSDKSENGDSVGSSTEKDSIDSIGVSKREGHGVNRHVLSQNRSLLDNISLVQKLKFHDGPIWAVEFSPCGKYLASAGRDTRVVVWSVGIDRRGVTDDDIVTLTHLSKQQEQNRRNLLVSLSAEDDEDIEDDDSNSEPSVTTKVKMIYHEPCRIYREHMDDVVDLSWTRKSFLLSASVDKTVRLWNVKMSECLRKIDHPDLLTAVKFHPLSERYCVTGCFDGIVRVWDLLNDENQEIAWNDAHDIVTAVCFTPDGVYVIVGLLDGRVYIYETTDLKYYTVIAYKKKKLGGAVKTHKVTGVSCISRGIATTEPGLRRAAMTKDKYFIMVTTNDSRIRLFTMTDFTLVAKFHGGANLSMQIKASATVDGRTIICGSDTGAVYTWQTPSHGPGVDDNSAGGEDGYLKTLYDAKHKNVIKFDVLLPGGNVAATKPCACTHAMFIPISAIHTGLQSITNSTSTDVLAAERNSSAVYSREDVSSVGVLTAHADGSLTIYFKDERL